MHQEIDPSKWCRTCNVKCSRSTLRLPSLPQIPLNNFQGEGIFRDLIQKPADSGISINSGGGPAPIAQRGSAPARTAGKARPCQASLLGNPGRRSGAGARGELCHFRARGASRLDPSPLPPASTWRQQKAAPEQRKGLRRSSDRPAHWPPRRACPPRRGRSAALPQGAETV